MLPSVEVHALGAVLDTEENCRNETFMEEEVEGMKPHINSTNVYDEGMKVLREHVEETCRRVMLSRSQGKGNFTHLQDEQFKREARIADALEHFLWREYCKIKGRISEEGCCHQKCMDCNYKRFNFHLPNIPDHWCNEQEEGWYCQEECECK